MRWLRGGSLVNAGLIPVLWRGELPGSERWFVVEMLPGTHPLDGLEVTLTRVAADQSSNLNEQLRRDLTFEECELSGLAQREP